MTPRRIISGGQTGADLGALRAGRALGIPTGGMMPRDYRTELGSRPWMRTMYGMTEHASPLYQPRTKANVLAADVTILFGETTSPGSRVTVSLCAGLKRPFMVNPDVHWIREWGAHQPFRTWNIAGNRESSNRGIEAYVYRLLLEAWADDTQRDLLKAAPWPDPLPRLIEGRRR